MPMNGKPYTLRFSAYLDEDGKTVVMDGIVTGTPKEPDIPYKVILYAIAQWAATMAEQEPDAAP